MFFFTKPPKSQPHSSLGGIIHKHVEITGCCIPNEKQSSCVPERFIYFMNLCGAHPHFVGDSGLEAVYDLFFIWIYPSYPSLSTVSPRGQNRLSGVSLGWLAFVRRQGKWEGNTLVEGRESSGQGQSPRNKTHLDLEFTFTALYLSLHNVLTCLSLSFVNCKVGRKLFL